jgi:hypothetical protein
MSSREISLNDERAATVAAGDGGSASDTASDTDAGVGVGVGARAPRGRMAWVSVCRLLRTRRRNPGGLLNVLAFDNHE